MSVFWAGAGAALLGALVGGVFTAFAAAMQAKASLQAVDHELQQVFAHEKQQRAARSIRDAIQQRLLEMSEAANLLTDITDAHLNCDAKIKNCDRSTLPVAALRGVLRKLDTSDDIYDYGDLPLPEVCNSGYYYDILLCLISTESAASIPKRLVDLGRKNWGKYAGSHCNYYLLASYGAGELEHIIDALRRTRDIIWR
jgi:hypothetical protein